MRRLPSPSPVAILCVVGLCCLSIPRIHGEESEPWGDSIRAEEIDGIMAAMAERSLATGSVAPEVEVISAETGEEVALSSLWQQRPVVLLFGSASCSFNVEYAPGVRALHEKFGKSADFAWIYLREAHPDGSKKVSNPAGIEKLRLEQARDFATGAGIPFSVYVDPSGDPAAKKFAAWPTRIYVVLPGGEVGFSGAVGPWGFRPLRITPNLEPDYSEQKSFVPQRHERPNLESYLERLFRAEFPIRDAYSGKPVLTSRNAIGLITSRLENCPLVGEPAIDVELTDLETGAKVSLRGFWEEKPLVLSMSSLSAEEFGSAAGDLRSLQERFGGTYRFLHIYLRESSGLRVGGDPVDLDGRKTLARRWIEKSGITFPVLVDSMEDTAAIRYSAWPSRVVVIGRDGRLRYRGYQGPWGLKVTKEGDFAAPEWQYPLAVRQKDVVSLEEFLERDSEPPR